MSPIHIDNVEALGTAGWLAPHGVRGLQEVLNDLEPAIPGGFWPQRTDSRARKASQAALSALKVGSAGLEVIFLVPWRGP